MLLLLIPIISSALISLTQSAKDSLQCYVQGKCSHASLSPPSTTARSADMDKLMVVGGYPNDQYGVQVIDLSGNNLTCPLLRNGPMGLGAVGTFTSDGRAMVCAGRGDPSHCYTYDNLEDEWAVVPGHMVYTTYERGSVALTDGRWWLAGGWSPDAVETEIVHTGNWTYEPFTALPRPAEQPTLLQLNESAVVFVAGWGSHEDVWLFNLDTKEWTQMPNMPIARRGAVAGLATFPDGTRQLVVAGGGHKTTHAFNFDTNTWRLVPGNLTNTLSISLSVQFKDSFLLVGGSSGSSGISAVNTIVEFDPTNEDWILREETLREAKYFLAAFLIPEDYVECV